MNVSDSGTPKQSSTTRVVITVVDINDNAPQFTDYIYRVRIPETPEGTFEVPLYRVVAYDRDTGPNAEVTYSLAEDVTVGGSAGRFTVHPQTGVIMSREAFTAGDQYDITVR